ncbi:hypothetical protein [Halanaerobium congolense]|jgi:mRNA interferase RelE/StbE|uniref:mRNA interferase RelE/StbE n=1 Tax=Halanaerobium congolense TaxID=54121 RepID=A0A4R7EL58_9FIRM|nr:hypothetical protein [Halanaerobium congolense]TDP14920.1 hypothetical protein C8C79_12013 [Halanaerobium congolense]TDS33782.1 hypothetical protein BY453_104175 [Halanaerobium congolense]
MKLKFYSEVKNHIDNLDGSVKPRLKSTLNKIKKSPELGKPRMILLISIIFSL